MQYRREIDGLRALAVVPVVLFHAGYSSFSGGFVGVDVFFVISGYLITSILIGENEQGRFSIVNFYERRARRILPALFFVMLCCIPVAWLWMLPDNLVEFGASLVAVTFFVSNFLFWKESGYFAPAAEEKPLLHTWSLAVEEQYYLLFPLLIMMLWPLGRRWLSGVLLVGIAGSLLLSELGWRYRPDANFYLAPFRAWELLIGSFIALYLTRPTTVQSGNNLAAALGAGLILLAIFLFDARTPFPSLWALLPVLGTGLIILYATPATWIGRILSTPPLVGIGLISYSVYLWHQPLFAFARIRTLGPPEPIVYGALAILSVFLGWLSWRYVEKPFRSKSTMSRKTIFTFTGVGMAFFALAGAWLMAQQGSPGRFAPEDREMLISHAERSAYVMARQEQAQQVTQFADNDKPNVYVVGDSFSQDFVNVLAEAIDLERINLAAHFVPTVCQIYAGDPAHDRAPPSQRAMCAETRTPDANMLSTADVIFVAAMWQPWSLDALDQSLHNLSVPDTARVIVVGPKSFGHMNRSALIHTQASERPNLRNHVTNYHLGLNEAARARDGGYLDVHTALCGQPDADTCPLFDGSGQLLSHDGAHLTQAGARFLGERLAGVIEAAVWPGP